MTTKTKTGWVPRALTSTMLLTTMLLPVACAGGGDDPDGQVTFALTDAASDELERFVVDVSGVTMHHLDGSTASVLTRSARVDFTELRSLDEIVVTGSVPPGRYTSLTLTLDFTNADVVLVGQPTPASVLDPDGALITSTVDVTVDLRGDARPLVGSARRHLYVLDLDLDQAVVVDSANNEVVFSPVFDASFDPANPKPLLLQGTLDAVDAETATITIDRLAADELTEIDTFTVQLAAGTVVQIDGAVATDLASALAALPSYVGQRVYMQGAWIPQDGSLRAAAVETGAGVPGNGQDWIAGHIVARDAGAGGDATLTVRGTSVDEPSGTVLYDQTLSLQVSLVNTAVLARGSDAGVDSDSLNVGQRIVAFGSLTGTTLDATFAGQGVVRMRPTRVLGLANAAAANDRLSLDLVRIGLRPITDFDFDVGGNLQADHDAFIVDVANAGPGAIVAGSKVEARGLLVPVDDAGPSDFDAEALTHRTGQGKFLLVHWAVPSAVALTPGAGSVAVDVSTALVETVGDGFTTTALANTPTPSLRPLAAFGVYRIVEDGAVELHWTFQDFADSLATRVDNDSRVERVTALGAFDDTTQVFTALTSTVVLR